MKRIYKGKTKLRILINTKCNLSGFVSASICFKKPDGIVGSFKAIVKDAEKGLVVYDVASASDIDVAGWWVFWPEIMFDDGHDCCGRAVRVFVSECGSL